MNKTTFDLLSKIFIVVLLWVGTPMAMKFGEIWERRVNPIKNTTVTLGDLTIEGSLSREWSGDLSLITDDGVYIFNRKQISRMVTKIDPEANRNDSPFRLWRMFLPAALLMSFCLTIFLFGSSGLFRPQPKEVTNQ